MTEKVIEALLASFFLPPIESGEEYEITLRNVAIAMEDES